MRCPCWHSGMPLCRIQTVLPVLQHRQVAPNPAAPNRWMTWMDSSMNKMMVPTCLHVPICCFLLRWFPRFHHSFLVVIQFPHFFSSHILPILPFWFSMLHMSFFWFCNYYVSDFPRWFPNDQWFFNCFKASLFPLGFCFFSKGGDIGFRHRFSQIPPPPSLRTQEVPPSIGPADPPPTSSIHI